MEIKSVSMCDYSSLRVGGEGRVTEVTAVSELKDVLTYAKSEGLRVHILGQGTNSYFGNNLSDFLFTQLNLKGISLNQDLDTASYNLQAAGSEIWDDVVAFAVEHNLRGIENLSYIPGTAGAAPMQNIGAYGAELADTFVSCEVLDTLDFSIKILHKEECRFGYRDSIFKHEIGRYVVLSITLALSKERLFILRYKPLDELMSKENLSVKEIRDRVIEVRKSKLPEWKEYANCGSFFKNPVVTGAQGEALRANYPALTLIPHEDGFKISAAWLIEHVAEMKGVKIGNLRTWGKQPLVIVNDGYATADEVDAFANTIKQKVFEKTGITLEQEVNRIG
ncbi:MAG: hypothetical protein RI935_740 [Candidatus Parcubacteria bacterium]|jgi:UDP-N-acetylmuramate dehydrogenase